MVFRGVVCKSRAQGKEVFAKGSLAEVGSVGGGGSHVAHTAEGSGLVSLLNARLWIRVLPLVTGAL